ncbi:MAG: PDZ domain-containing protein, partial [Nitrososphaera sp.]
CGLHPQAAGPQRCRLCDPQRRVRPARRAPAVTPTEYRLEARLNERSRYTPHERLQTLRDFGRITEAVGAFSRYADMISATDPTAKRYSEIAVQFTLQLKDLGVKGGMYLYELKKGGSAERVGLQVGDILISYDGKLTPGNPEFIPALKDAHSGEPVKVEYLRLDEKGRFHRRTATLAGGSLGAGAMPV